MNYIGSKLSLVNFIEKSINEIIKEDNVSVFCDLFAGTGAVGLYFKKKGYKVIANDMQYYAYVLNRHHIGNSSELTFKNLVGVIDQLDDVKIAHRKNVVCEYLQNLDGIEGFVYKNYCPEGTGNRKYFTEENSKKCDAIRDQIEFWYIQKNINDDEYYFLLSTLLEAMDKCANTASVYGAFLKEFKKTATKSLKMTPLQLYRDNNEHTIYNENANDLISKITPDVLYLDPPYNSRQYSSNYHILETIAKNDNPKIRGKTGLRDDPGQKSLYCSKTKVKEAFSDLINRTKAKYIFLSYNNEGLLSFNDIKEIMSRKGRYGFFKQEYSRFKADSKRSYSADMTIEYLHYVVCD